MISGLDTFGRDVQGRYATILADPSFERRLKMFDPRLKLVFDQTDKRWVILEWAYDNSGWNVIIKAEDDEGNPKPLGEWVFNKLWVFRKRYEAKQERGVDQWMMELRAQAQRERDIQEEKSSDDHQAMLREDVNQWKKVSKEIQGLPASDAVAGYPKIDRSQKNENV